MIGESDQESSRSVRLTDNLSMPFTPGREEGSGRDCASPFDLSLRSNSQFTWRMQSSKASQESLIYELPSIVERLDLAVVFPKSQPLEIELGCGDASFLVGYATRHPEHNFIGVERLLGRIRKLDRKGRRTGLTNLRGLRIESAYFLEYLLPARSAIALHVYFPDPWPKRKHRRHRLINERFPEIARQSLAPGGIIYLRTDDRDYFDQMVSVFGSHEAFQPAETPDALSELLTDFEKDFQARGIGTLRAAYRVRNAE